MSLPPASEYVADFMSIDNKAVVYCKQDACPMKQFPAGTKLEYLHSRDPGKAG